MSNLYNPGLGRFLQVDPVWYDDQVNLYAYVGNDPVNNGDPSGNECTGSNITNSAGDCKGGGHVSGAGGCEGNCGPSKAPGMLSRPASAIANHPKTAIGVGVVAVGACVFRGCEALGIGAAAAEGAELLGIGAETAEGVLPAVASKVDQVAIREVERDLRAGESVVPVNAGAQLRAVAEFFAKKVRVQLGVGNAARADQIREVGIGAVRSLDPFKVLTPEARQQLETSFGMQDD